MKDKLKVQVGAVNAIKAASKALKAVYHEGTDDTVSNYLYEARNGIEEALGGVSDKPANVPEKDIAYEEVNDAKIEDIAKSIDSGNTTIDDWNGLYPEEKRVLETMLKENYSKDLYGDEISDGEDEAVEDASETGDFGIKDEDDPLDPDSAKWFDSIMKAKDSIAVKDYTDEDKDAVTDIVMAGKLIRRAVRSINRHVGKGDCRPNITKLRKVNFGLVKMLHEREEYTLGRGMKHVREYALHLLARANEVIRLRERAAFSKSLPIVLRFVPGFEIED